jgi:uncharacterized protein YciI
MLRRLALGWPLMTLGAWAGCAQGPANSPANSPANAPATAPVATAPVQRDWFIFLETGLKTPDDAARMQAMQRGHIDNFKRLFAEGRLTGAGPMRDPDRVKRGIVVVRADSLAQLQGYFEADDYVHLGHMTLNASPARVHRGLATTGIEPDTIEEVRILMIGRRAAGQADASADAAGELQLQALLAQGRLSAWYSLETGPVADVLFARSTDDAALRGMLAAHPGVASQSQTLRIWPQWLGKGVLR